MLSGDAAAKVWLRRLYTDPKTGELATIDARRRLFEGPLRRLLIARAQWSCTPWCGAPIRHADHVVPTRDDGAADAANGQGLCETCNQAKEAPGWTARPRRRWGAPLRPRVVEVWSQMKRSDNVVVQIR